MISCNKKGCRAKMDVPRGYVIRFCPPHGGVMPEQTPVEEVPQGAFFSTEAFAAMKGGAVIRATWKGKKYVVVAYAKAGDRIKLRTGAKGGKIVPLEEVESFSW